MKKFSDYVSSTSMLFLYPFILVTMICLFHPGLKEFGFALLADTIGFAIVAPIGNRVFLSFYPESKYYFSSWKQENFIGITEQQKATIFHSLTAFPLRRSIYYYPLNCIKIIPAGLVVLYVWHHECSIWMQLFKFVIWQIPIQVFTAGTTFIEAHIFVSKKIKELHKWIDLTKVFESADTIATEKAFFQCEAISFISLTLTTMITLFTVINQNTLKVNSNVLLLTLIFIGHLLIVRLYFLNRKFLTDGLTDILKTFSSFESNTPRAVISLSSSGFLARFAKVFNGLTLKLQKNEQELAQWLVTEVEESRYRTVGEIAGMVAHDLRSPLNTVSFCVDTLKENQQKVYDQRFMNQLSLNADRSVELVKSLMAYLKNHSSEERESVYESFIYVKNILATQYPSDRFAMIHFNIDESLRGIYLQMSRIDLIHVLNNLMQNSLKNLIKNDISFPQISLQFEGYCEGQAQIVYGDNGTGLKREEFEEITSFGHSSLNDQNPTRGLGLRLTRRLIERNSGDMSYLDANQGTHYRLCFNESFYISDKTPSNLQ